MEAMSSASGSLKCLLYSMGVEEGDPAFLRNLDLKVSGFQVIVNGNIFCS